MKIDRKWIRILSSFVVFFIVLVLYTNSKIIVKNNYKETDNKLYLILLFIIMVLYWKYFL
jgi:hypothetical protein